MNSSLRYLVAGLFASAVFARAAELAVPFRDLSFDAAAKAAAAEGKVIFIDFYTTWCAPCKQLDAVTFTDPAVGRLLGEKTIPLKFDAEKGGRDIAQRYTVNVYPTLLVLKADGTELDRIIGFREPARFIEDFNTALTGRGAVARAREAAQAADGTLSREAVQARYDLGRTLAQRGQYAEALREFLWCYDEGMVRATSFMGVRTSFLTSDLGRVADKYPPAKGALLERREATEQRLKASASDRLAASEFAALCEALDDKERMMAVFETLPPDDPRRRGFGPRVFRILLARQRYADALTALPGDSIVRLVTAAIDRPGPSKDPRILEANRRYVISSLLDYIEVLAGAGEAATADDMVKKLKTVDASAETERLIEARLQRARLAREGVLAGQGTSSPGN